MSPPDRAFTVGRARWAHYAVMLWSGIFVAPHIWWAFGSPLGFPGGVASHQLMMTSRWRYIYDLVVVLMSFAGAFVALLLLRDSLQTRARSVMRALASLACGMLSLRGVAGMIVDGTSDPIWWPLFLVGGILFGIVAWRSAAH